MTIASEKTAPASERFLLVRFNPARWLNLVSAGGNLWTTDCTFLVDQIKHSSTALTKDTAAPVANLHWYQDPSTFVITIYYTSTPSETNEFIAYHYLYYTGSQFRSITSDPEDNSTDIVDWNPRITQYPSFYQSFSDILSGVFSITDTTITLANGDSDFQKYLTAEDTFYNTEVDIWVCLNDETNIQKIFHGTVTGLSLTQNTVTLRVADSFKQLDRPAFMGDLEGECIFRRESGSFPSMDPNKSGTPCPYVVGGGSRFKTYANSDSVAGIPGYKVLQDLNEAICTDYSDVVSTTTNRVWGLCRTKLFPPTQTIGTGVRSATNGSYKYLYFSGMSNVHVGDTFTWNNGVGDFSAIVRHVGDFTYSGNTYNLIVGPLPGGSTLSHSDTFTNSLSMAVLFKRSDGTVYELLAAIDYALSFSTTSAGHIFTYITFIDNFEANYGVDPIEPSVENIYYRISNAALEKHGTILKDIVESSGLSADATTFTDANTALPVTVRFQIPNFDELDYDTYLTYAQSILKSTMGYLRIDTGGDIEYILLSPPSSGGSTRDQNLILDQSMSLEIEYQDIATSIIFYNPHFENQEAIDSGLPSLTVTSQKAEKLNRISNVDRFRHVLEDISTRAVDIAGFRSMRRATYKLSTATEDIDTNLGDNLAIDNKTVIGDSTQVDVMVVSIDKSPRSTSIEAIDLEGL